MIFHRIKKLHSIFILRIVTVFIFHSIRPRLCLAGSKYKEYNRSKYHNHSQNGKTYAPFYWTLYQKVIELLLALKMIRTWNQPCTHMCSNDEPNNDRCNHRTTFVEHSDESAHYAGALRSHGDCHRTTSKLNLLRLSMHYSTLMFDMRR